MHISIGMVIFNWKYCSLRIACTHISGKEGARKTQLAMVSTLERFYCTSYRHILLMFKSILMCVQSFWTCVYKNTVSSRKYSAAFCKLLWGKNGKGVFVQILNWSHTYVQPSPHPVPLNVTCGWKSWWLSWYFERMSASLNLYCRKSARLVLIFSWGQLSLPVITGDNAAWCCTMNYIHLGCGKWTRL